MYKIVTSLGMLFFSLPVFLYMFVLADAGVVTKAGAQSASLILASAPVPEVSAQSYFIFDLETGIEVASHAPDTTRPIASVTKLISSTVFYMFTDLNTSVTMLESDLSTEGESGQFVEGDTLTARELIFPALIASSNDASVAQARVFPDDMLLSMHAFVSEYDINDTAFADTSGLSAKNTSSARSLGVLLRAIAMEYPHLIDITTLSKYVHSETTWFNNSPLANLEGYKGGKHGFTHDANRTAAVLFSDDIDGKERRFGYVLLGSADLVKDITSLRNYVVNTVSVEVP